jgi:hypothetical protein
MPGLTRKAGGRRLLSGAIGDLQTEASLSEIEPDRDNCSRASPRQYSFGKIAAVFLIVGPPIFGPFFYFALDIPANGDPIHTKISEAFGSIFSPWALLSFYVMGIVPASIVGFAYSKSYRTTVGYRPLVATLVGAIVYFLVCALVVSMLLPGQSEPDWRFAAYATGGAAVGGGISAFFCALIMEMI